MKKRRFTPEQILQALHQAEGGTVVGKLCEFRALREENRKLRQVVDDLVLDKTILKDALGKHW
jgi:hypothetical protein